MCARTFLRLRGLFLARKCGGDIADLALIRLLRRLNENKKARAANTGKEARHGKSSTPSMAVQRG